MKKHYLQVIQKEKEQEQELKIKIIIKEKIRLIPHSSFHIKDDEKTFFQKDKRVISNNSLKKLFDFWEKNLLFKSKSKSRAAKKEDLSKPIGLKEEK